MPLWDAELEALRPKFREESAAFIASFPSHDLGTADMSVSDRVARQRQAQFTGPPSANATDRAIDGPAGPLRLRVFPCDEPDGVLFHIHGGAWMTGAPEMMDQLHDVVVGACNLAVVSVD